MEEEFEPIRKTEEEIKEFHEEKETNEPKQEKKRKVSAIISRIIWGIIFLIMIFEVVMGLLNTQKINADKEPIWCITYSKSKEETRCHLGLYVIVKAKEGNETTTSLRPFFLK